MMGTDQQRTSPIRHVRGDGSILIASSNLRFRIATLRPGILLMTAKGSRSDAPDDAAAELAMLKEFDAELKRAGSLTVFADLRETARMSAQSRDLAANWMRANKEKIRASHVLVRSKLVEMALSIVGMVVGGGILKMYSKPSEFLSAARLMAPDLRELPNAD